MMHGGDITGYREKYGTDPIDLSVNISPLGMPEGVKRAAAEAIARAEGYPDVSCRKLCAALSARYGTDPDRIFCSCGAADIIFRLAAVYRRKRALVAVPAFTEYERSLKYFDCDVRTYCLSEKNGFLMTEEDAERIGDEIREGAEIVFIGQPANPSGRVTDISLLRRIADTCDEKGAMLVIDECFIEFVRDHERYSLIDELARHKLILIRSFTKLYAMAGLRIGYCLLGRGISKKELYEAGQPWPVSSVAEEAAAAALKEKGYAERVTDEAECLRKKLKQGLELAGCKVIPSDVNYLLFYHKDPDLYEKAAREGILIRECSDYTGLGKGWYRVAVTDDDRAEAFLKLLS